jgi:hypothetical protein
LKAQREFERGPCGIAVIHIVWKSFGLEVFRKFVTSYTANAAGQDHRLILLFKGFEKTEDSNEYTQLVSNVEHHIISAPDRGYDIGSYLAAVGMVRADYYCFLNSKSEILGDEWLGKLYSAACRDNVGIVGATGSWESLYTDHINACDVRRPDAS